MSYVSQSLLSKVSADPFVISNDQVKDTYLMYVKLKTNLGQGQGQGQGVPPSGCQPGLGQLEKEDLQSDNALCNPGLENMKNKVTNEELDDNLVNQLSKNIDKKETILKDKLEKLRERMEKAISEEEEQQPIPPDQQKKVDDDDKKTVEVHKSISGDNCRNGNVLSGASNEEDLKVLAECQEAVGDVMHTKKMDDGDYKFLLKLDDKYDFLINDKNNEKTDGLLVVEVVPDDQNIDSVVLPESGDKVHIWGAWVTDKPKGWHEIHPTWQITKE
ncbi:MAG TPA: hypothetical protein VK566_03775 [Nitrososphaeraceae archaeon]|nr:hypothetical protein [Nitrososphaeraceae archaeon]